MIQSPARDEFQVLDWIMSRHVHEYLDVAGRPIGEGRAAAYQNVPTEMQSCPYAGSRHHHSKRMNVSALRNIMPVWDEIVTMLFWLSQRYRAWRKKEITSYDDLSLVTSAGVFLMDFLVLREHHPVQSHDIPLLISGLYKACLGFQLATFLGSMDERFACRPATTPLPNSVEFYGNLEAGELLIGDAEVCSGSAAMIMEVYDAIVDPRPIAQPSLPLPCTRLEIDWERFDVFVHHAANIWNELVLFVIDTSWFCPELADSRLPPEVQDRLNNELKAHAVQLQAEQKGLVVDIGRAAAGYCGVPGDWRSKLSGRIGEPSIFLDESLAEIVLLWLNQVDRADMQVYGQVVASALQAQLRPYDLYEATVLGRLNEHLNCLMHALGRGYPSTVLSASALSRVCGRTLRDWGADS